MPLFKGSTRLHKNGSGKVSKRSKREKNYEFAGDGKKNLRRIHVAYQKKS